MVKNGCGQSFLGALKIDCLKNKEMEQTDFLHVDTDLQKLKTD